MPSKKARTRSKKRKRQGRRTKLWGLLGFCLVLTFIVVGWYLTRPPEPVPYKKAPNFALTDLDGTNFQLLNFTGKVVLVDFMATWCGPCKRQMDDLQVIWEKPEYQDHVILISIDIDPFSDTEATLRAYTQEFPSATWIWALDTGQVARDYQVGSIPKVVIIDQNGYLRFTHTVVTTASTFIHEIDQLLK